MASVALSVCRDTRTRTIRNTYDLSGNHSERKKDATMDENVKERERKRKRSGTDRVGPPPLFFAPEF